MTELPYYNFIHLSRTPPHAPMGELIVLILKNAVNGVKTIVTFNLDATIDAYPEHLSEDAASRIHAEFIKCHLTNCCIKHGCKYGQHDECPVALEILKPQDEGECGTCWEDRINVEADQKLIDSFEVSVTEGAEVAVLVFGDDSVSIEPHIARAWADKLRDAANRVKPKFVAEFEGDEPINVEEWASLTYLVFPSGDIPDVWVGHCLEVDVVSYGTAESGAEGALEMTLQAAAIIIEMDRRAGMNPFERMAPPEKWPRERLKSWIKIRAELGAQATWKGYDPNTESFISEDAAKENDNAD